MKIPNKNFVLLLVFIMAVSLLSCKSEQSNTGNAVIEEPQIDDYDLLRNPAKAHQRINEDLSGKVIVLTEAEFEERITDLNNPKGYQYKGQMPCVVLLYNYASVPSAFQSDVMNNLAPEYQGRVIFYKVDLDKARGLVSSFEIKKTPVILYFKPHRAIKSTVGLLEPDELRNTIDKYLLNP